MNSFGKIVFRILMISAIAFSFSLLSFAQEITGSLNGTVRDSNGAVVPGATVTIMDSNKGKAVVRTLQTNNDGAFSAPNLAISIYEISVEAPNFKKTLKTDIKLDVGARRTVDVLLEAGDISEVVTVEADPVAVELSTPTSSTVISGAQVRELPINNRNFVQLVTLAPGVSNNLSDQVYTGTVNPEGQANTVQISVNGARSSQNTFTVDGADVTDRGSNLTIQAYPSVDSIGEFKVLRSLYPAESGRSGGGQVNVVTRSGTDDFHGSFFEFVRNEKLNANKYFDNQNAPLGRDENGKAKRSPFRYNNFGWTVGGPVYFLKFGEREPGDGMFGKMPKTYFFFSQEFRRDIRYPTLSSTVPDGDLRRGIFPVDICLQASGTACTLVLPANTPISNVRPINPLSQQYINNIYNNLPLPNSTSTNSPYSLSFPTRNRADFQQEIFKIDTAISENVSMYYRFQNDKIPTLDANSLFSSGSGLPGVALTDTNSPGRTHTFQGTYVVTPNVIIEGSYRFGYGAILSKNIGLLALANSPIQPPLPYTNQRDRVPTISGNGFSALQGFGPYDNFSWKQNFSGSLSWIKGSHTMKFGMIYSLYRKNENALAGSNEGLYSGFNTPGATTNVLATGVTGTVNQARQQWANFLQGTNAQLTQASFDYTADLRQKTFEWYAQDEFRIRKNLTLYYGLRYSFFGSPYDRNGRLTNFVPELFDPAAAPLVTGAGARVAAPGKNFCNGIIANTQNYTTGPSNFNCTPLLSPWGKFVVDAPKNDFAPRVGLAWDPFGKGESSIRMGYGIYHDQVLNGTLLQQIGINPPYQQTCTVTGIRIDNPVPSGNCTVAASSTVANLRGLQTDWITPYIQHWSLDFQQQLSKDTMFTVGYYGSRGVHLIGAFELNELAPGVALNSMCAVGSSTTPTVRCLEPGRAFFSSAQTTIIDQIRPYRGFRSINLIQPRYNSNYHSMQISAQHRFSGSSQVNLAYTWSKNLSDNQTDRSTAPQNSYDIRGDYGRAALDRRHILTINYIYDIPFFKDQRGFVGKVLGGWQVQGIGTYQTGIPFTVTTSSFDPAGLGFISALVAGGRPNLLCDPNRGAQHTQQSWFDTTCFSRNPLSTTTDYIPNVVGTAPRGIVEGPSTRRVDFTVSKNFRFNESMRLQLRAETFNVFNTTNFSSLSTNVTSTTFGRAISARDPRQIQLGAKFYW